jgi:hypothetical protein
MSETWRPVVGFEGRYEVSDLGRVASMPKGYYKTRRILQPFFSSDGYALVNLCADGSRRRYGIHSLVLEAFSGLRPEGMMARHLDGDPGNNTPANLRWGTAAENAQDMLKHGRGRNQRKTECRRKHPFDAANTYIDRKRNARRCRRCDALAHRKTERTTT